jgi:hypothetical protein
LYTFAWAVDVDYNGFPRSAAIGAVGFATFAAAGGDAGILLVPSNLVIDGNIYIIIILKLKSRFHCPE